MGATSTLCKLANIIVIAFEYVLVAHIPDCVKHLPHVLLVFLGKTLYERVDAPGDLTAGVVVVATMDCSVTTLGNDVTSVQVSLLIFEKDLLSLLLLGLDGSRGA